MKPVFISARGEDGGTRADRREKTHREKKPILLSQTPRSKGGLRFFLTLS